MNRTEKSQLIWDSSAIAIIRGRGSDQLLEAAHALLTGGARVIEVTMTTPDALSVVERATRAFGGDALFGASSAFDRETAWAAILGPLPQLEIVPAGGVDLEPIAPFIQHGAVAVGVGTSLVSQGVLDSGDMDELNRRAAAFISEAERGRVSRRSS